ncbi:MAG: hypothetical protein ACLGQH_07280 [Acidobacteriota bacterium]
MTTMDGDLRWLETLAHMGAGLVFLLVGWRLGRESVGRPMFEYRSLPAGGEEAVEEADPWSAASIGSPAGGGRPAAVDIFETLRPANGAGNGGRGGCA